MISSFQHAKVKWNRFRKKSHVVAVAVYIAFKFRKSDIVWIKRKQPQPFKFPDVYFCQTVFVVFGYCRYADLVQVDTRALYAAVNLSRPY